MLPKCITLKLHLKSDAHFKYVTFYESCRFDSITFGYGYHHIFYLKTYLPGGFKKSWSIWNRCKNALGIRYNGLRCCFITPPNMGSYHRGGNGAHLLRRYCLCLCLQTVSIITHHTSALTVMFPNSHCRISRGNV